MEVSNLDLTVDRVLHEAFELLRSSFPDLAASVSYCCIFCQTEDEFDQLNSQAQEVGAIAKETATGNVYVVPPIRTPYGPLRVVKVRKPDETRTELGDIDLRVEHYAAFKEKMLGTEGVSLIVRPDFEMIELVDAAHNARLYFSNPPVEEHDGVRQALEAADQDQGR